MKFAAGAIPEPSARVEVSVDDAAPRAVLARTLIRMGCHNPVPRTDELVDTGVTRFYHDNTVYVCVTTPGERPMFTFEPDPDNQVGQIIAALVEHIEFTERVPRNERKTWDLWHADWFNDIQRAAQTADPDGVLSLRAMIETARR